MHDIIDIVCHTKRMPREAFEQFSVTEGKRGGKQTARVAVYNEKGQVHSYFDVLPNGKGLFRKGKGSSGLFFPGQRPQPKEIWLLTEGVEDASTLVGLGYLATGMNTSKMARKYARLFRGCDVVLVGDLDTVSVNGVQETAARLYGIASSVRIARLPGEVTATDGDDVRDVLARDGDQAVRQAVDDAIDWIPGDDGDDDGLPAVTLPGGAVTITQAATELGELLGEQRRMFTRGGSPVLMAHDRDGRHVLHVVTPAMCCSAFETVARLFSMDKDGTPAPAVCSESAAKVILNADRFLHTLPEITVVTRTPVLIERDGELFEITGYDESSGVFAGGDKSEGVELDQAKEVFDILLRDFRFASPSDRSRAAAAILTPALVFGGFLQGRPPLDLGEANDSQAGKGYRNRLTAAIYGDTAKCVSRRSGGVGSIEESFDQALIQGASFISLDNIRGKVDSQSLESFLTESSYWARVPYSRPMEIDPSRIVVMLTSNRAELTDDLANRSNCVRIVKQEPDYSYQVFGEGDLLRHIMANRGRFLGAVFAVIREWHARGKPQTNESRHDFKVWARALDWMVQNLLGEAPLMDGHRESQQRMTNPAMNWLRDVAMAVERTGHMDEWLQAHDLLEILDEDGAVEIPGVKDQKDDLSDDGTRTRALQAIGRKLSKCFRKDPSQVGVDIYVVERQEEADEQWRSRKKYRFRSSTPLYETRKPAKPPIKSFFSESDSIEPIEVKAKDVDPPGGIGGSDSYRGVAQTAKVDPETDDERGWL